MIELPWPPTVNTYYTVARGRKILSKKGRAYKEAVEEKKKAYAEWEAAKIYMNILLAAIEKYRTDQASERTMMRAGE